MHKEVMPEDKRSSVSGDALFEESSLIFLEERFRNEVNDAFRLEALKSYALEALLVGRFWRMGSDGKPFARFIFESDATAAHVGQHVFRVLSSMPGMSDALDDQLGPVLVNSWRKLVLNALSPMTRS